MTIEAVKDEPACNHANTTTTTVDATCTAAGSTTVTCNDCGAIVSTTELPKLDHTYVDGECSCGAKNPSVSGEIVFDFGDNGTAGSHTDGAEIGETKTYTSGNYTLVITNASKAYDGGFDKTGNSILKFGTSSIVGTITFVVPEDVKSVVIYAARYKSYEDNNLIVVNGTTYTLTKNSDDGQYDAITVDTTTNKTIVVASSTDAAKPRCVVNSIVYILGGSASGGETPDTPDTPDTPAHTCADADGNYVCDSSDCGKVVAPAADSTLTITQALALGKLFAHSEYTGVYTEAKYYVTGTIKKVYQTTYGNMYLTDAEGNELTVYGTYDSTGATKYGELEVKPVQGDTITVYGVIGAFQQTAQMNNGWITAHTAHNHTYTDATCTDPKACSVCGLVASAALGHSYTNGVCSVCGKEEVTGVVTYVLKAIDADGNAYYWNGSASDGKGAITTNESEAAVLTMEAATNGVYVYYTDDSGAKHYITIGTKNTGFGISTTATEISYDAANGYLYANDRYVATYKTQDIRTYLTSNIPGSSKNMYMVLTAVK